MTRFILRNSQFVIKSVHHQEIGLFDIGYQLQANRITMQPVVDWLAENCTENFIVVESISCIVAGGYSDNKSAGANGRFDLNSPKRDWYTYTIQLHTQDNVAFALTWIDNV
jgi:hypothetical protein